MKRVPMPPPDSAPFRCNKTVRKPAPTFWDECGEVAVEAWQPDATETVSNPFLELRCVAHAEDASEEEE